MGSPKGKSALQYTGIGIEIISFIGLFVFIGIKLDDWVKPEKPWFTVGFSLFGVIGSMVYAILRLNPKKKTRNNQ